MVVLMHEHGGAQVMATFDRTMEGLYALGFAHGHAAAIEELAKVSEMSLKRRANKAWRDAGKRKSKTTEKLAENARTTLRSVRGGKRS